MLRDMYNGLEIRRALSPVLRTDDTAQVSQIIDMQGFDALLFAIGTGAIDDANVTFVVLVEHGDQANLSDAAAVPDAELVGTEVLAGFQFDDDNETRKIGYIGAKRYVRLTITPTGNSANPTGAFLTALAILGRPHRTPTATP